jgi:hypothetical protein
MMTDLIKAYTASFSAVVTVFFYGHSKDNVVPTGNVEVLKSVGSLTGEM